MKIEGVSADGYVVLRAPRTHTHAVMCIVISFCVCIAYPVACMFRDLTIAPNCIRGRPLAK